MPLQLAQQRMTFSDLEWPFHPHCALYISAVAELLDDSLSIFSFIERGVGLDTN